MQDFSESRLDTQGCCPWNLLGLLGCEASPWSAEDSCISRVEALPNIVKN